MELFEKSMALLELPAVLRMLRGEAVSDPAKEKASALCPAYDINEVEYRLSETTAAKKLMVTRGSPSFYGVRDVSASLKRAAMGGMLNTRELLEIAGVLKAARAVRSYIADDDRGDKSCIDHLFYSLNTNKYFEEKITTSITGEDEIADGASAELASIRRHMRIAEDKVRSSLQKIVSSPSYAKALQEAIITMRNGRYVVPVKADHKSSVPGLVHDISASGATLFVEPMSVVQANNEIRELQAKEKKEIERILSALSAEAASFEDEIICDFKVLVELDLIFAKAKLSYRQNGGEPELSREGRLVIRRGRHPLLPPKTAVPIDVRLGGEFDTLVITGPNTGGKTVTLKTIGIFCLMTLCGLHIPADDGSSIPVYKGILADIGDEQSIEQSLSTFSAHMTNTVSMLEACDRDFLLLFDELGAGTDPVEGAALAMSIIEYARGRGAQIAATTHYSELKLYATSTPGVQNASCEFDVETLRPTYRLLIGIPGKSNAFAISKRLGLDESIIDDAKKRIDEDSANFEDVIEKLERTRQELEKEKTETRKQLRAAEENAAESEKLRRETEEQREKAAKIARREADEIIQDARRRAEAVFDELNAMLRRAAKETDWQEMNKAKAELRRSLNEAESRLAERNAEPAEEKKSSRPIRPGDTVQLRSIGTKADVISVSPDRVLTLQAGIMKITAKEDEVLLIDEPKKPKKVKSVGSAVTTPRAEAVKPELDIRGLMVDEALPVVERFIDSAVMSKLNIVTVIHGKGTGALKKAVRQSLRGNRQIKSFRPGRYGEGEDGVTVIELK